MLIVQTCFMVKIYSGFCHRKIYSGFCHRKKANVPAVLRNINAFFTVKQKLLIGLVNLELQYKELERRRKGRNVHENMKVLEIKMFKEITC